MRTVFGFGRQVTGVVSRVLPRRAAARAGLGVRTTPAPAVETAAPAVARRPLLTGRVGPQHHAGAVLDQVDGTTCGSAVLVALATWADPAELGRLETPAGAQPLVGGQSDGRGFGARYDAWQKQVHRQTNRFWPQALGTTPWGAARWLRDHAPKAGRYRVRLVDDTSRTDVDALITEVDAALATRPVPLLVGTFVPRHYVLALGVEDGGDWRVYEPTSGQVRLLGRAAVRERRLAPVLGFDRLHAALLPV